MAPDTFANAWHGAGRRADSGLVPRPTQPRRTAYGNARHRRPDEFALAVSAMAWEQYAPSTGSDLPVTGLPGWLWPAAIGHLTPEEM